MGNQRGKRWWPEGNPGTIHRVEVKVGFPPVAAVRDFQIRRLLVISGELGYRCPVRRIPPEDREQIVQYGALIARQRRFPLNDKKFQLGMLSVVLLVALRLTIGSHFFYEGVWKIANSDKFSARPFLTMAKGPFAPLFYSMIPDLDGGQRLALTTIDEKNARVTSQVYLNAWTETKNGFVAKYGLDDGQVKRVDAKFAAYEKSLWTYLTENQEEIVQHFDSLDRFKKRKASGANEAAHEKKRIWDEQMKLRSKSGVWISELDAMGEEYCLALWDILGEDQRARGSVPAVVTAPEKLPVRVPYVRSRGQFLDMSVTYGLTAIGLCLLLGFCNRLACLGGGAFLLSVLMTQPPWPMIYPPAPPVVGHAMVVDKNFVEMMALLVLATLPVGRWGGLDYFLYHWLGRPIRKYFNRSV